MSLSHHPFLGHSAAPDSSAVPPLGGPELPLTNRWGADLSELARAQRGVLGRAQLRRLGWSHNRIEHEIRVGRWSAVAPRVVAVQNAALTREQLHWLGVLHAGPTAALTHASASEVAGLRWTPDPLVHVITARGDLVSGVPGLRFHQTRRPYAQWLHPTAAPRRLRVEYAALLTAERDDHRRRAIGLLAAHVQQRITSTDRLLAAAGEISKLRHGTLLRLSLHDIAAGAQSFAEIDVGRLCSEAGLRPPQRQRLRVDDQGRRRYLDCEWRLEDGRVIALEVDGSFHMRAEHWWRDMRRERDVVLSGRTVLRCASVEIRLEPEGLVEHLRAAGVPPLHPAGFVSGRSAWGTRLSADESDWGVGAVGRQRSVRVGDPTLR